MNSSLESFSIELLFELFEYLSPFDLFRSFTHLNYHFDDIVRSYPLRLNFRSISRSKFDVICRYIRPEQVVALSLSDENMPDQVKLFMEHFPNFKQQFISLQSMTLIEAKTTLIDLPISVSSISIRNHHADDNADFRIGEILIQQESRLTHLTIDEIDVLYYTNIQFSALTHLTIDGGVFSECNDIIPYVDRYDTELIPRSLGYSLTHIHLFIDGKHQKSLISFEHLSHCLTHLTLHFNESIQVSFESVQRCVIQLYHLTHFTIQASGTLDLIDGQRWEQFIFKTTIIKLCFKFKCEFFQQDNSSVLESFRSPFWLEQKRWYVGCYEDESDKSIFIYSIPRFRLHTIHYPSHTFPHITTAPPHVEEHFFYRNKIDSFFCDFNKVIIPPIHRFTQVKSLHLSGSSLLLLNILLSIVDLHQIQSLDVSNIVTHKLDILINHTPRLKQLTMIFDPLFIIPSQICHLILIHTDQSIPIDILSRKISSVETLEIKAESKQMIIDIIDRLDHLANIILFFNDNDRVSLYNDLTNDWLTQNTHRLSANTFTRRDSTVFFPCIYLSIGDKKDKI